MTKREENKKKELINNFIDSYDENLIDEVISEGGEKIGDVEIASLKQLENLDVSLVDIDELSQALDEIGEAINEKIEENESYKYDYYHRDDDAE